jgi:hypothetical protein
VHIREHCGPRLSNNPVIIEANVMKKIGFIIGAILLVLVGLGFILPAVAKLRSVGFLPGTDIGLLLFGMALVVVGPVIGFVGCWKRGA